MLAGMVLLAAAVWWSAGGLDPVSREAREVGALPVRMLDGSEALPLGQPAVVHVWLPG
jgi:hypothetical protein